jgi:hypothetical protein
VFPDAAAEERDPDNFDPTVNLRGMIASHVGSHRIDILRLRGY